MKIRPIAFYLPQYHPIPENDAWWGKGFTEWTNVTKQAPRFEGHYQPHLPSDQGFYDLRLHEVMIEQAAMAKQYGIHGFMFYHYWFSGKRILERPVNQWLQNKSPDFPFCICWANENWTRSWDGQDTEVLLKQEYNEEDDRQHFYELARHFKDERYITIEGKPLFAVYRTNLFPNITRTAALWREEAIKAGLPGMFLVTVESFKNKIDPRSIGFDAAIEFQPDFNDLPPRYFGSFWDRVLNKLRIKKSPFIANRVVDYGEYVRKQLAKPVASYKRFPGITPMWDNSARRRRDATIFTDSSPEQYGRWLLETIRKNDHSSAEENFLFINAWNEWAEGNHLEPCQRWGKRYLETTKQILDNA